MEQVDFINYMFNSQTSQDNLGLTITFNIDDNNNPLVQTSVNIKTTEMSYLYSLNTTSVTSAQLRALADKIDASSTVLSNKIAANLAATQSSTTNTGV
jgi:hypothetical protein